MRINSSSINHSASSSEVFSAGSFNVNIRQFGFTNFVKTDSGALTSEQLSKVLNALPDADERVGFLENFFRIKLR